MTTPLFDLIIQFLIGLLGVAAIYMSTGRNPRAQRWAAFVGLCGQPFWIVFSLQAQAWGLLVLSVVYSAVYARGVWLQLRRRR
jgi:hypothetical protein